MTKCKDCKYSLINDEKRYCLRFPPTVRLQNPSTVGHESVYPEVENNWKCGEGATE